MSIFEFCTGQTGRSHNTETVIYINKYDIVGNIKFGFCRMMSCPESVLEFLASASDYMDEQDSVAVLCLGFQSAFDDLLPKTLRDPKLTWGKRRSTAMICFL